MFLGILCPFLLMCLPDIKCCDFLDILDSISYYGSHTFALHGPVRHFLSYMVTCSFPQNASKNGGHHHSLGAYITTFGSSSQAPQDSFRPDITFLFLNFNSKENLNFLFCHIISVSLHGSSLHHADVYVLDQVKQIPPLPKRKIPP